MTLLELRPRAATKGAGEPNPPTRAFPQPLSTVFADLLPDEVRTKRRLAYLKRRMGFGLVALGLVIGLGDALARQQTHAAADDLATAKLRINALSQQAARFGTVVGVQAETQRITSQLTQAMAGNVPWATLAARLQRIAPRGLVLTGVNGQVGTGSTSGPTAPTGASGPAVVGSLSLTGTASSYPDVANYVSALGSLPGLIAVNPATTSTGGGAHGALTFTITASLTTQAEGGRYSPPTGGAAPSGASSAPSRNASGSASAPAANPLIDASTPTAAAEGN